MNEATKAPELKPPEVQEPLTIMVGKEMFEKGCQHMAQQARLTGELIRDECWANYRTVRMTISSDGAVTINLADVADAVYSSRTLYNKIRPSRLSELNNVLSALQQEIMTMTRREPSLGQTLTRTIGV